MNSLIWYCVERDSFVIQHFSGLIAPSFEWSWDDVADIYSKYGSKKNPMKLFSFILIGEL